MPKNRLGKLHKRNEIQKATEDRQEGIKHTDGEPVKRRRKERI